MKQEPLLGENIFIKDQRHRQISNSHGNVVFDLFIEICFFSDFQVSLDQSYLSSCQKYKNSIYKAFALTIDMWYLLMFATNNKRKTASLLPHILRRMLSLHNDSGV